MTKITTTAIFFLAAGLFTSVTVLGAYQILFAITALYYAYLKFKEKDLYVPLSAKFLLGFFLVALVSLSLNYGLLPKPGKNFGRIYHFIIAVAAIFSLKAWLKEISEKTIKTLFNVLLVSIIISGSYTCYTYFITGVLRADVLTEKMRYGYGTGMILLIILGTLLHSRKLNTIVNLPLTITAFVIGFLGMYLTFTRGALLGFICGLPFLIYFYNEKIGKWIGMISLFLVVTLGSFYFLGSGEYQSRFLMNKNNPSDVTRRSQWTAALIAVKERPLLGWGYSNFHTQLKRIKNDYDLDAKHYNDAHSHNLFLEIAAGTGIIGLFLFLGWLISWAIECFKNKELVRALIVPFGVAFVISSQFEVTFDANNCSMILFLYSLSSAINFKSKVNDVTYVE